MGNDMSETNKKDAKEAMKALRHQRKETISRARDTIKTRNKDIKTIREAMKTGEKTVPEIAASTGMPSNQVLFYVATLKKYGTVVEGKKDGDYFKYALAKE
jgi:Fic family protein